jgi:hypothetical protein
MGSIAPIDTARNLSAPLAEIIRNLNENPLGTDWDHYRRAYTLASVECEQAKHEYWQAVFAKDAVAASAAETRQSEALKKIRDLEQVYADS